MKCKIVVFFSIFGLFFFKMLIFEVTKFYLTKYQISNQVNFFSGCISKIHIFNGVVRCQIIQNFWIMSPLSRGFF